ncbi:MAG: hypothetical protein HS116_04335 [Planctomycetes bacterium]|nr:hypothetical protein [Planctomycetota bacterium]
MRDEKPKRAWFQVHLSTLVALMFVAGVLMWANTRPNELLGIWGGGFDIKYYGKGWPIRDVYWGDGPGIRLVKSAQGGYQTQSSHEVFEEFLSSHPTAPRFSGWKTIALNVWFAFFILAAVALPLEYLARRRERNQAP